MNQSFVIQTTEREMIAARDSKQFGTYARFVKLLSVLRRQFVVTQPTTPVRPCVLDIMKLAEKDGIDPVGPEGNLLRERLFELICKGSDFREIVELLCIPDDPKKFLNKKRVARTLHNHLRKHLTYFCIPVGQSFPKR